MLEIKKTSETWKIQVFDNFGPRLISTFGMSVFRISDII